MKTLKLRPLTTIACLVSITTLGMAVHYAVPFNPIHLLIPASINPAQTTMAITPIPAKMVMQKKITQTSVQNQFIDSINPATVDLMRAIVLQSLESGFYTLATLPAELKPFAPPNFGAMSIADTEKTEQPNEEDMAEFEAKFAEMSADDYVPPEPEFKCPDPYDLPTNMRNSRNIETLKEHGCEVFMEDQQVQVQTPNTDSGDNDTAMYDSSI
jgi:hypothetical protein